LELLEASFFSQNSAAHEGGSCAVSKCKRISVYDELFHLGWRDVAAPVDFPQALIILAISQSGGDAVAVTQSW
jgi:hypothetical protein